MAFRSLLKVRFGDIDHAGIVYYPRFLHYFHVALEEFFGSRVGVDYSTLIIEPFNAMLRAKICNPHYSGLQV